MRKAYCLLIFCVVTNAAIAQNVATINNKTISSKEFMWAYKKSHNGSANTDYNTLANYLNLYINFKLKVLDAKEMGLDKSKNFQEEVKTYENALAEHKKVNNKGKEHDFLLNEYREGVLMFNISEQKIWSKAQDDDEAIAGFYQTNKLKYNKPLSEIKGDVIADYQQKLEENWLNNLKQKYQVKINENELRKLAKL
ncbi:MULTISPECIES: hypothetical protein [unclassified Pedobacter]|uniref:hypothetical protein n=1 Tax=unclassified Pedobacter TaxID=2628915 RepID=UPI001E3389F0|nr:MULTISPECIES: hypothetical protein [unclassified Pedobacter]